MTAPVFYGTDDTAFDADTQVSTAHLKQLEEELLRCFNERRAGVGHSYAQTSSQTTVRLPRLHSARWAKFGPFPVYVPNHGSNEDSGRTVNLVLRHDVDTLPVRLLPMEQRYLEGRSEETLDTLSVSGSDYYLSAGAEATSSLPVLGVRPGRWNLIWFVFRSEIERDSTTYATGTADLHLDGGPTGPKHYYIETGTPTVEEVPEWAIVFGGGAEEEIPYTYFFTAAVWKDVGAGAGRLFLAENSEADRAYLRTWADVDGGAPYSYGDLGVIEIHGWSFNLSADATLEDANFWGGLRWKQPPSASTLLNLFSRANRLRQARYPQICCSQDLIEPTEDYPGIWIPRQLTSTSEVLLFRYAYVHSLDIPSDQSEHVELLLPFWGNSNFADEAVLRFTLKLRNVSETVVVSDYVDVTVSPYAADTVPQFLRSMRAVINARANWSKYSMWAFDGVIPAFEDSPFQPLTLTLDCSGVTWAADEFYWLEVTVTPQTTLSTTKTAFIVPHNPGLRLREGSS